jgi:hypothetical protein
MAVTYFDTVCRNLSEINAEIHECLSTICGFHKML